MSTETTPYCYRHPNRETHIRCQRCGRPICPDCMNQAAVGFQCPSCVHEGRKTQRSAQAAYGGQPSANPALTSQILIGINVAVWLLITASGGGGSSLLDTLPLRPAGHCEPVAYLGNATQQQCIAAGGTWLDGLASGAWWQVVTSMFTHVQLMHIGFNMLALWFLGPQLEAVVGRARFLVIYFLSGLVGSAFVYWLSPVYSPTLGASGAIFGLMGALLVIAIKMRADYSQILLWIGLNVLITVFGRNISWQGHLGGLVGGVLITLVLVYAPRRRRTLWQVAGLSLMTLAVLGAIVVQTVMLGTPGTS